MKKYTMSIVIKDIRQLEIEAENDDAAFDKAEALYDEGETGFGVDIDHEISILTSK